MYIYYFSGLLWRDTSIFGCDEHNKKLGKCKVFGPSSKTQWLNDQGEGGLLRQFKNTMPWTKTYYTHKLTQAQFCKYLLNKCRNTIQKHPSHIGCIFPFLFCVHTVTCLLANAVHGLNSVSAMVVNANLSYKKCPLVMVTSASEKHEWR